MSLFCFTLSWQVFARKANPDMLQINQRKGKKNTYFDFQTPPLFTPSPYQEWSRKENKL